LSDNVRFKPDKKSRNVLSYPRKKVKNGMKQRFPGRVFAGFCAFLAGEEESGVSRLEPGDWQPGLGLRDRRTENREHATGNREQGKENRD